MIKNEVLCECKLNKIIIWLQIELEIALFLKNI